MKSFVKSILFLGVAILYVVSTMGFGVHRCTSDGSASVMLLFGNAPCAYAHSHGDEGYHIHTCDADSAQESSCPGHHCDESNCEGESEHHDEDCCSTDVYVVTHDQTLTDDNSLAAPWLPLDVAFISTSPLVAQEIGHAGHKDIFGSAHGALHKSHSQASFCVFRV